MSRQRRKHRGPSPLAVLGIVLLAAILAGGGWAAWQYWGSTAIAAQAAADSRAELRAAWDAVADEPSLVADPVEGQPLWLIRIPALGETWEWPVVAGVGAESLERAVGWYPGTSQPGQIGNFAVAGQCITGAQPFRELRTLQVGDAVVVEGADAVHTYEITSAPAELTVGEGESWVLDPVPGHDEVEPTQAFITLTTCEDLYPTPDRSVGFGVLTSTEPK